MTVTVSHQEDVALFVYAVRFYLELNNIKVSFFFISSYLISSHLFRILYFQSSPRLQISQALSERENRVVRVGFIWSSRRR